MSTMTRRRPAAGHADGVADKIASLRLQRTAAQAELKDLRREVDASILGGRATDTAATKLAMAERKVSALAREIERLEQDEMPEAREADAEAVRESMLAAARELHAERLEIAEELQEHAAKTDELVKKLLGSEGHYHALCYDAGYSPRELSGAAVAAMLTAMLPGIVAELAGHHNFRAASGQGPVELVKSRAVERLPRTRQDQ